MPEKTNKDWKKFKEDKSKQTSEEYDEDLDDDFEAAAKAEESTESFLEHPSYQALEEKLTASEQKAQENWEKSVRALAELDNVRRRAERDVANAHRFALEKFAQSLLPVLDSLEQAMQLAEKHQDKAMHEGLELTIKLFSDVLQKHELEILDPQGQPFNPQEHEAMAMQESDEEPNTVIAVFQKGYKLNDRVIRPARVVVAKSKN